MGISFHLSLEWLTHPGSGELKNFRKKHPLDFSVILCGFSFSTFQTREGFSVLDSFSVWLTWSPEWALATAALWRPRFVPTPFLAVGEHA